MFKGVWQISSTLITNCGHMLVSCRKNKAPRWWYARFSIISQQLISGSLVTITFFVMSCQKPVWFICTAAVSYSDAILILLVPVKGFINWSFWAAAVGQLSVEVCKSQDLYPASWIASFLCGVNWLNCCWQFVGVDNRQGKLYIVFEWCS